MRILITGATGFIGRNLLDQLKGHDLLFPTHKELDLTNTNAVRKYFKTFRIDCIIHCAVKPFHRFAKNREKILYENLKMFFNLAEQEIKMIFISSGVVYGKYKPRMKEEYFGEYIPVEDGAFSKYICEKYIERVEYITALRLFGVYGKYEPEWRFISYCFNQCNKNKDIEVYDDAIFDFIWIGALVDKIDWFIKHKPKYKVYNICSNYPEKLSDIAKYICEASNDIYKTNVKVKVLSEGTEYTGDASRLYKEVI
jgi:UDP-glucose 4-epimerase